MKLINAAGIVRVVSSELDTVEGIPYPVPGKDMDAALELLHAQGNHNHDLALDAHRGRSCHLCALIVRSTLDDNESRGGAA